MTTLPKREIIARRIARELRDGFTVNLGIGMPTLCANYIRKGIDVLLHSENGLLGIGPYPTEAEIDPSDGDAVCSHIHEKSKKTFSWTLQVDDNDRIELQNSSLLISPSTASLGSVNC